MRNQEPTLLQNEFTLEEWPTDPDRVRIILPDGQTGPWFSRLRNTGDDGVLRIPVTAHPAIVAIRWETEVS